MLEIDVRNEKLVLFSEVKRLNVFHPHIDYQTVYHYAKYGRVSRSGNTVYLEYVKTPSGFATSEEACYRFIEALNE